MARGAIPVEVVWLTQVEFAAHIGVPVQRVNEIVRGRRGVSAETAWLFSQAFGTTPEFWLNLQRATTWRRPGPTAVCPRRAEPSGRGDQFLDRLTM